MTCICITLKVIRSSVKNNWIKLKGEVGMVVLKSTQTRVVGVITYKVHVHPYACFSGHGSCVIVLLCSSILIPCRDTKGDRQINSYLIDSKCAQNYDYTG